MKTLNRNNLVDKLSSIWYVSDTEDENKKICVERRNVRPLILLAIRKNPEISSEDLWELICDNSLDCELEELHYGSTTEEAFELAEIHSSKAGEVSANVFVNSDNTELKIDHFNDFCQKLCTALDIDTSKPRYWERAYENEISPLEAVQAT